MEKLSSHHCNAYPEFQPSPPLFKSLTQYNVPVRHLLSSLGILYHVIAQLQKAHLVHEGGG